MNNLLPQHRKNLIHTEYISRLFLIAAVFIIVASLFGALSLIPSYIFSSTRLSTAEAQYKGLDKGQADKIGENIRSILDETKNKALLLKQQIVSSKILISVQKIVSVKRGDVSIIGIDISPLVEGNRKVSVRGVATSREALVRFSKDLGTVKEFKSVEVPLSNFEKSSEIPFVINFSILYE